LKAVKKPEWAYHAGELKKMQVTLDGFVAHVNTKIAVGDLIDTDTVTKEEGSKQLLEYGSLIATANHHVSGYKAMAKRYETMLTL
jgi:hypothetical protein